MIIHNMEQYSPEWWSIRKGIPTASCASKIVTPTGNLSVQSRAYMNELIADSLGFGDEPTEPTEWMTRGLELEPEARAFYEFDSGLTVDQVGFITNDEGTAGCSPDGLIVTEQPEGEAIKYWSGWECKCPKASTHIGYLLKGGLPDYYKPQVHFSMAVSGIREWVFVSYFPGLEPLIVSVEWDEYTDKINEAIAGFTENLAAAREKLGLS